MRVMGGSEEKSDGKTKGGGKIKEEGVEIEAKGKKSSWKITS